MKNLIKDAVILFTITLIAGLFLGFVFEFTKEDRALQAEKKKNNAYKTVFVDYDEYKDVDMESVTFDDIDISKITGLSETLKNVGYAQNVVTIDGAVSANNNGNIIGYAITVTSKEGYGGDITFTVGFNKEGIVTGVSILSISETAGLGMNAKEKSFLDKYVGKSGGNFVVNKDNKDNLPNEIDAISGATITTRAITKGVNAAYITAMEIMSGGDTNE